MIPPEQNSGFVAAMERVREVYKRPYDPRFPVVCMDESPKQLIAETRQALPGRPGSVLRYNYEYQRVGVCTVFMANEPLVGLRLVEISQTKKKQDWAMFPKQIVDRGSQAQEITLVMDNLNTHKPGSLYEVFSLPQSNSTSTKF